jgi:hypothetical protein
MLNKYCLFRLVYFVLQSSSASLKSLSAGEILASASLSPVPRFCHMTRATLRHSSIEVDTPERRNKSSSSSETTASKRKTRNTSKPLTSPPPCSPPPLSSAPSAAWRSPPSKPAKTTTRATAPVLWADTPSGEDTLSTTRKCAHTCVLIWRAST